MTDLDRERVFPLNRVAEEGPGDIYYWMTREQRLEDNWALNYACRWADLKKRSLKILFFLPPRREEFAVKSYEFMIGGLVRMREEARQKGFSLYILHSCDPENLFRERAARGMLGGLVCDFHPLREFRGERERIAGRLEIPVREVDGHNIVPCRYVSDKQEFAAYTLRNKIAPLLTRFLREIPPPQVPGSAVLRSADEGMEPYSSFILKKEDLERLISSEPVYPGEPGYEGGMERLYQFLHKKWDLYGTERNNPVKEALSGLSPYLHFGQIAPQTAAFEAARLGGITTLKGGFLDEIIVRRELSDNFCFHNARYDREEGFPDWARQTLAKHGGDPRPYLYSPEELEEGVTHDDLWNAAQKQMADKGKMHGYMRMYWAKKILEWSPSAGSAMERAVYLNDKYSLDGEDPNGYAGCAWAIGGLHDRAWQERPVFGKIRYMNEAGCRRKFPVKDYIRENLGYGKEDTHRHKQLSLGE